MMQAGPNRVSFHCRLQRDHFRARQRSGFGFPRCLHDFCQSLDLVLRDEHTSFPVSAGVVTKSSRVMGQTNSFHIEMKSEACNAMTCPVPQSFLADTANDLSGLSDVQVSLAIGVDKGRGLLRHPQIQAHLRMGHKPEMSSPTRGP